MTARARADVERSREWDRRYVVHIHRSAGEYEPQLVTEARGSWLTLSDGRRLLDLHGQYMCIGLGHGHPRLREALHRAVDGVGFVSELMTHEAKGRAARALLEDTMEGSDWAGAVKFVSSGSEAVEAALMIARLVTGRPTVVATQTSYHGWTSGAAAVTTMPSMRNAFHGDDGVVRALPVAQPDAPAAPAPLGLATDAEIRSCVAETERVIRAAGVDSVAAFITEIYHGSAGYLAPDLYVRLIREMTQRLGILWIDDEAIAGAGRTGRWWAFQHCGVEPDLLCTAKGIGSSAAPAGAVVVSREIAAFLGSGRWAAVSTNSGHPLAMAAIAATIEIARDEGVIEHAAEVGAYLGARLAELVERHPCATALSGRGLAWAFDLVKDPGTGERWVPQDRMWDPVADGDPPFVPGEFVAERAAENGVLLVNCVPNTVTIAPALTISRDEVDLAVDVLDRALTALDEHTSGMMAR